MILRGAVLSESRLPLEPVPVQRAALDPRNATPSAAEAAQAPEPVVVERLVTAPITFEAVVEWLEQGDSRRQLAAYLAADVDTLRANAKAAGLAEGKAEGLAQAQAHAHGVIGALETLVSRAEQAFDAETEQLAAQCAEVVCAAIARIAGPVLSVHEAALGTVLEVLKHTKDERELTVRVSAHDLPALREYQEHIERACAGRRFTLVADPKVDTGGCIVESELGSLDGRFDVQLRGLCETLRAAKAAMPAKP